MTNLGSILKSRDTALLTKVYIVKAMAFLSNHVQVWELDHKEGQVLKNRRFWIVVLEKTLESSLDCTKIKPIDSKGSHSLIFIGSSIEEAEALILWPPNAKNWLIRKDHDAGKDWRQEEKGTTEDEMVGWHRWFNWHEVEQTQKIVEDREAWYLQSIESELDTT